MRSSTLGFAAVLALSGGSFLLACGDGSGPGRTARPAGIELAFFDPIGDQFDPELNPLDPTSVGAGVGVSALENITYGLMSGSNTGRRPVVMGAGPLNVATSFYLTFIIDPATAGLGVFLDSLTYTYASYIAASTGTISLRTSADGFATTVDSKAWFGGNDIAFVDLVFDASSMPFVTGPLEVRLYMHDLVGGDTGLTGFPDPVDWADLVSSEDGGDGLRVFGNVHTH